jgi:hypothetical protein
MQAVDDALPLELLQHLQHVFSPGADFWRQHAYGRVGYFSYFFQLVRTEACTVCVDRQFESVLLLLEEY